MIESISIRVVANGFTVFTVHDGDGNCTTHSFESADALLAHLRRELPMFAPRQVRCDFDCSWCAEQPALGKGLVPGIVPPKSIWDEPFCDLCQSRACNYPVDKSGAPKKKQTGSLHAWG